METLKNFPLELINIVTRKGVFPFEYLDNFNKLYEIALPHTSKLYSSFDEKINDDDYAHAQKVWKKFCIKTLGKYSDIYLLTDVLILANIFESS